MFCFTSQQSPSEHLKTFTASLVIPVSTKANANATATSTASSFDQVFGNQKGTVYIKDVRIAAATLVAVNPSTQSMGSFKSVKMFISNGSSGDVMVASRTDIAENIGSELILDIDNSRFLDKIHQRKRTAGTHGIRT